MTGRESGREQDVDLLRTQLHQLVEDVEPRGDALPRLLAATRRRRMPQRRPLLAAGGMAVAATAVFLVALLVIPGDPGQGAEPVSVQPNSYVAEGRDGVVSSFDVVSGRKLEDIGRVSGEVTGPLVADGKHVYASVSRGARREVVEVAGGARVVASLSPAADPTVLTAAGGRVAYVDRGAVRIADGREQRRIPLPEGMTVVGLALDPDGRLAVLTTNSTPASDDPAAGDPAAADRAAGDRAATEIHLVAPGATTMTARPVLPPAGPCGPVALAWSGRELATVQPVECGSGNVRIATLNRDNGEPVGAGAPFDAGSVEPGQVHLSTDRLGRFLLATSDARQWLVDGADVVPVPPACAPTSPCAPVPGTFWG